MSSAKSHILDAKPHSLSYQAETLPILSPITLVRVKSTIAELELWLKSIETRFSSVASSIFFKFFLEAFLNESLILLIVRFFFELKTKSTNETFGVELLKLP